LPHVQRWLDAIRARPAVQRGIQAPPSEINFNKDSPELTKQFTDKARTMVEMGQSQAPT
jgi:glutathione S-transferase/GST-like protein